MSDHPQDVDAYIAAAPEAVRPVLVEIRRRMLRVAPDFEETIRYQLPTLRLDGHSVVHFAGWQHHVSVYPVPEADEELARELAPYRSGKGTLRFPLDAPIPYDLIARVTALLVEQRTH